MEFNLNKFLVEHKLTKRSRLNEDDNTGGMMKTDAEKEEMGDEETFDLASIDPYGGEYNKGKWGADIDTGEFPDKDYEKEPTAANVKTDRTTKNLYTKQKELQDLEHKKDALLMQLKSGQLGLDQYKVAIGNIPAQIKKLRLDIDKALGTAGDEEELPV